MSAKIFVSVILLTMCLGLRAATFTLRFQGDYAPVSLPPDNRSGLDALYVAHDGNGLTLCYTPDTDDAEVSWSRYSTLGGAYAEPVLGAVTMNGQSLLSDIKPDMGYIVTENGRQHAVYIVNWSARPCELSAVTLPTDEQDCATANLVVQGHADILTYTGITGRSFDIDRGITVTYTTLAWDETAGCYRQQPASQTFASLTPRLGVDAAYCATRFTVSGDTFMEQWGIGESIQSSVIEPIAITAHDTAVRLNTVIPDNHKTESTDSDLGGSAPAVVSFSAAVSDAAIFHEWQFASDPEFNIVTMRFGDLDFDYSFDHAGITYVRLMCANADASCEYYGDTYTIPISESALECPNVFSPGNDGTNDQWKVSYRSIIKFDCRIFDRGGQQITRLTDPSQGWDGRRGGKFVPAGVYYYVIKAEGSDGRKYNLSGDINIIGYR